MHRINMFRRFRRLYWLAKNAWPLILALILFYSCHFTLHLHKEGLFPFPDFVPNNMEDLLALNCPNAIGVKEEELTLRKLKSRWELKLSDQMVADRAEMCDMEKHNFSGKSTVSLAFGLTVHDNLGTLEAFLQLIFRPHHSYCISVDAKADELFRKTVGNMIDCYKKRYPNTTILMLEKPIAVYWGHISLLKSDLACLKLLLGDNNAGNNNNNAGNNNNNAGNNNNSSSNNNINNRSMKEKPWKYFLNLAGSELPTMSMEEMEETIERTLQGKSLTIGEPFPKKHKKRIKYVHKLVLGSCKSTWWSKCDPYLRMKLTNTHKSPPPHNMTIYKGLKNVVLNRTFSSFLLKHPSAKQLLFWLADTLIPDESFYATLSGNLGKNVNLRARYTEWENSSTVSETKCRGMIRRDICQFSMLDLPRVAESAKNSLFVNKFNATMDSLAVACWVERIRNRL